MMSQKSKLVYALLASVFAVPALSICVATTAFDLPATKIEMASRYQLRSRTPSFFERSKTSTRNYSVSRQFMRA